MGILDTQLHPPEEMRMASIGRPLEHRCTWPLKSSTSSHTREQMPTCSLSVLLSWSPVSSTTHSITQACRTTSTNSWLELMLISSGRDTRDQYKALPMSSPTSSPPCFPTQQPPDLPWLMCSDIHGCVAKQCLRNNSSSTATPSWREQRRTDFKNKNQSALIIQSQHLPAKPTAEAKMRTDCPSMKTSTRAMLSSQLSSSA